MNDLKLGCSVTVDCWRPDGALRWRDVNHNIVVTVGKNDFLQKYFTGSGYTAGFYCGLKGSGVPAIGDTLSTHPSWSEVTGYSQTNRPTVSMGTAVLGSIDNSAARATFSMTATIVVYGVFMSTNSSKAGISGVLFNAADLTVSRNVINGDVLNVTINPTVT